MSDPKVGEWESVPKGSVDVKSAGDWEAVPKSQAPSFGEKAGAAAYGLGTGIVGSLGELEKFGAYDVPQFLGLQKKGETQQLGGRETLFPTIEEARKMAGAVGIERPRAAVRGYETAGELAPALYAGGRGIYKLGKYGAEKLGKLIGGGKDLAEELKATTAGKTAQEITAAEKKAATAEKRIGATEKIAEREAKKGEAAYEQLPGVTTTTEAGVKKSVPQAEADIGTKIRDTVQGVYDRFKATRQANAEKNKAAAFNFAKQKELDGAKVEDTEAYKDVMKEIKGMINDPDTKLAVATLDPIKNPLLAIKRALDPRYVDEAGIVRGKPVSFQGMEDLRRFLRDRSYGLPAEGFDAINQQKAGKLADSIEKVMSEFSNGKINTFINQYRKDSEPLRVFQTKVGKALVDNQLLGKDVNYANVPAQSIPKKAFASPDEYYALVDTLGGNKTLADQQAQRYFSGLLESKKTAKDVRKFIAENRTMLKETNSYEMAGKYAQDLEKAEKRGAGALERGKAREPIVKEQKALKQELDIIQSDIARADEITDATAKIKYINKQAEKLADLLPLKQRDQFLKEVQSVANAEQKKQKMAKWIKYGIYGVGAGGLGSAAYSAITGR